MEYLVSDSVKGNFTTQWETNSAGAEDNGQLQVWIKTVVLSNLDLIVHVIEGNLLHITVLFDMIGS